MQATAMAHCTCDECQSLRYRSLSDEELNDLLESVEKQQHVLQTERQRRYTIHSSKNPIGNLWQPRPSYPVRPVF